MDEAEKYYSQALELQPNNSTVKLHIAWWCYQMNKYAEALKIAMKVSLGPKSDAQSLYIVGKCLQA
jgi:Tfp pilus assembly protein PilF